MWPVPFAPRHTSNMSRRELLQVGYSGLLGVGLPTLLSQNVRAATSKGKDGTPSRKPKSIVLVFLTGAASHHDTFDMKPDAPAEVRGEFQSIATSVAGFHVCEHLPRLANVEAC